MVSVLIVDLKLYYVLGNVESAFTRCIQLFLYFVRYIHSSVNKYYIEVTYIYIYIYMYMYMDVYIYIYIYIYIYKYIYVCITINYFKKEIF